MEWLNLHTSILDSPELVGSDPIERGTWLMLLRFCIGQENSGIISSCRTWKSRKWQQLVRVTQKEVFHRSELWQWHGDDLHITHYPLEKQEEVRTNRINGKRGGRPKIITETKPQGFPSETQRLEIAETERKGKEGNKEGKGKEAEEAAAQTDINAQAQRLFDAYATARRSHLADGLREAKAAILRHGFTDVMTGTQAIVAVVQTWTPAEKLTYVKRPDEFFRGDHWADDPSHWLPRKAREEQTRATASTDPALSLGGRKPASTTLL
jgi:hypothetical protein